MNGKLHRARFAVWAVTTVLAFSLAAAVLAAPPPSSVSFQGRLTDAAGEPQDGPVELVFRLFDAPAAGTLLWSESWPAVPVAGGIFHVLLGSNGQPLGPEHFGSSPRFLELEVGGETLAPRFELGSAPFALRAAAAESADSAATAGHATTADVAATAGHAATADSAATAASAGSAADAEALGGLAASAWQRRVSGSCPAGQAIRAIGVTGTVTCIAVQGISGVQAGPGLLGGGSSGEVTLEVDFGGPGEATSVARADHGHEPGAALVGHSRVRLALDGGAVVFEGWLPLRLDLVLVPVDSNGQPAGPPRPGPVHFETPYRTLTEPASQAHTLFDLARLGQQLGAVLLLEDAAGDFVPMIELGSATARVWDLRRGLEGRVTQRAELPFAGFPPDDLPLYSPIAGPVTPPAPPHLLTVPGLGIADEVELESGPTLSRPPGGGLLQRGPLVVARPLRGPGSGATAWFEWARQTSQHNGTLGLALDPAGGALTYALSNLFPSGLGLVQRPDGSIWERMELRYSQITVQAFTPIPD